MKVWKSWTKKEMEDFSEITFLELEPDKQCCKIIDGKKTFWGKDDSGNKIQVSSIASITRIVHVVPWGIRIP